MTRNWQDSFQKGQGLSPQIITQLTGLETDIASLLAFQNGGVMSVPTLAVDAGSPDTTFETWPLGHGWTNNAVGAFADIGDFVNGDRSYQITTNGAGADSIATSPVKGTTVDFTNKNVVGWIKLGGGGARVPAAGIRLRLSSGTIATNYVEAIIFDQSNGNTPLNQGSTWARFSLSIDAFALTGTVNLAAINQAQLLARDDTTGVVRVLFDEIGAMARPSNNKAVVSVCFDDGCVSQYTLGLPKLSRYRIPATSYIICDTIDTGTAVDGRGVLTSTQLATLRDTHGWDIQLHSGYLADHNQANGLQSLTAAQLEANFVYGLNFLRGAGFPADHIAYPVGFNGGSVLPVSKKYLRAGRGTPYGPDTYLPRDMWNLRGTSIKGLTETGATINALIDTAIAQKSWLILTFHDILTTSVTTDAQMTQANFNTIIDYIGTKIAAGTLEARTVGNMLRRSAP